MGRRRKTSLSPFFSSTERTHSLSEDLDFQSPVEVVRRLHHADLEAFRAVSRVLPRIAKASQHIAQSLRQGGRLIYVGAGTSGRLGMLDATECPPTFGTHPSQVQALLAGGMRALTHAVEGAEDDAGAGAAAVEKLRITPKDCVCGISASATTPFVQGALKRARRARATTLLVCCNVPPNSPADLVIALKTGPELIAGSTRLKAGTATKLVLNALTTAAMVELGKVFRGRMVDLKTTNQKLRLRAERMVSELARVPLPKARGLLREAKGRPSLALAMHWTGMDAPSAGAMLESLGLRALEANAEE